MINRIKVIEIISDTNFGGAGQYLKSIIEEINKEQFELTVIIPEKSVLRGVFKNVTVIECNGINDKSLSLKGIINIYLLIKQINPQVIHTHASLSGRIAGQLYGVKNIIYTKHTLSQNVNNSKKFLIKTLNRILRAKVIAISKAVEANLIDEGIKSKNIRLIYNGIKKQDIIETKENEMPIITLIGRLEEIKGPMHMIEITKKLTNSYNKPFLVWFAGAGSLEDSLKNEVQRYNLPVVFLGHVNKIDDIYLKSDIIVNTSNSEALSYVAMEGMMHGKPVIAFDVPGINEVIENGKTGFLLDFKDYDGFSQKIIELLDKKELGKKFGGSGRERVLNYFGISKMIDSIEELYKEDL